MQINAKVGIKAEHQRSPSAAIMRRANFRGQKTLEGFDFDRLPNLNRAVVHDLATCRFIDERVSVLIAGPCGTGKSQVSIAVRVDAEGQVDDRASGCLDEVIAGRPSHHRIR
jgi:DNA replication protein DnaC